jgi:hypothetical protein
MKSTDWSSSSSRLRTINKEGEGTLGRIKKQVESDYGSWHGVMALNWKRKRLDLTPLSLVFDAYKMD